MAASTSNLAETSCRLGAKIIKPGSALFIRPKFPWPEGASKRASTNRRAGAGGPGSRSWEETAGAQRRGAGGGTWPWGWLLKLVPFFLRTWTLLRLSRGNSDSLSAYLRPPHPPASTSLSKFGNTFVHVGALCRHRPGQRMQTSGQPGSCRGHRSPEIKAGAVQPCLTLCPAGHRLAGGGPGDAAGAAEQGGRSRQRGAARGRGPPPHHPAPRPRPAFLQLWGVWAPTFSAVALPFSSGSGRG